MERQQEAYKVAGVDEAEPALDPRKRKAADSEDVRHMNHARGTLPLTNRRLREMGMSRSTGPKRHVPRRRTMLST